jgi:hypothetical protein
MARCSVRDLLLVILVAWGLGCGLPPGNDQPAGVRLALVTDTYLFKVIQVVQVNVIKAASSPGLLSCLDVQGGKYNPDDPRFELLVSPPPAKALTGHSPTKEVVIDSFEVPAGERALILVRGLAQHAGGTFPVAQGCKDELMFEAGSANPVEIDVTASTGAACSEVADCQVGLSCQRTPDKLSPFYGGYCAKVGCGGDQDCPPGSRCISSSSGGNLCLRACEAYGDCTIVSGGQAVQDCVGRVGPTVKGCGAVCVYPTWDKARECVP